MDIQHDETIAEIYRIIRELRTRAELLDRSVDVGVLTERRDGTVNRALNERRVDLLVDGIQRLDKWSPSSLRMGATVAGEEILICIAPSRRR